ncbi:MAG: VWA domain-containing protein [Chloroflexi bacterium]|nr:VWA domain-containing protein [Chloroflexota bacterium]
MSFSWPLVLLSLILIPVAVAIYAWLQRRKRRFAVRYASLSLIRDALPRHARWRRHLPFALYLLSLASLMVAASRPQAVVAVPTKRASIILAMDVSLSMCSSDVAPNRLTAAQDVASRFIKDQPGDTRIGIVAFSGLAQLVVPPTTDRKELLAAIEAFRAARGTAIGSAVLKAVDAIAEINPNVSRSGIDLDATPGGPAVAVAGDYQPDIIVLLTDGATTQGVDPIVAAQEAADRGVRVYTIGFGTDTPAPLVCSRDQLGSGALPGQFGGPGGVGGGGGGGGARRQSLVVDEETLASIAELTGGTYHKAEDAEQLDEVFKDLPNEVAVTKEDREVSVAFVAMGALAAIVAVALSLAWNRYP